MSHLGWYLLRRRTCHSKTWLPGAAYTNNNAVPWDVVDIPKQRVKVWIDQDLCTGDGICTDHAPEVFTILEDGIAYCKEAGRVFSDPGGAAALALVPIESEAEVVAAANECPGECIFVEFVSSRELELPKPAELYEQS